MALSITDHFQQLTALLSNNRAFWQILPFNCAELPWQHNELNAYLWSLNDTEIARLDTDPNVLQQAFSAFFPAAFELTKLPSQPMQQDVAALPFWLANGIGGRKLQQIDALCQHWTPSALPIIEWCAGKGHLGRILAHRFTQPVTSVEWQRALCDAGEKLAEKYQLPQRFVCDDVLTQPLTAILQAEQQIVALHACGQLHITLLEQMVQAQCRQLHLVPCCYHLIPNSHYRPLSSLAQQEDLTLSKEDLKLAVQGQVTAGDRIEKLRATEVLWRLVYDELRAEVTNDKQYRPLSSVAKHWFTHELSDFVSWAAAQHSINLPDNIDWACYMARAEKRAALVKRIDLIRHIFRRPLELWLSLDKALFLQQQGYCVSLTEFCDYQVTPRNILLRAYKAI
ncbi:methyltransferase [Rheinheimera baltica]|uniref:Methyltransferase n=1 Tax=Rheinheimera baltica TaxID=67576 RepID=A0ABT9I105_9GAMM|nr:methyltransferase [Rheinheimera baltica]MDP5137054.1 methyltransferase [Rheinheimera baltica]